MKKSLLLLIWIIVCQSGKGSHIVGGELFYDCLGNNQYKITLKLYRDCSCTQCAAYGDPEYLSIFDASGNLYSQPPMPFPGDDTLNPTFTSPCMVQPPVCVQEADYTCTVTLPPATGGYDIVYQRCCRNAAVVNLVFSEGATYTTHIPDPALATCNNSARFNHLPPIYICVDAPLSVDYSASDPDGDSLVYSLCDPLDGASTACPDPSPNATGGCASAPPAPPYFANGYIAPYSASNFTNNPSNVNNLTIDPQTGLLTGTPNTNGVFDVTVCVSEYRNGQLLNVLRRDFQFTIAQCNIPIASVPEIGIAHGIGIYSIDCKSFTIGFVNTSYNPPPIGDSLTYHWNFGVPGSTSDTSDITSPSFTYPDTGTYLVQLVAIKQINDSLFCADTTEAYVYVYPTFTTGFTASNICQDSAEHFVDQTISTSGNITQWYWNFGDNTASTAQNPNHNYAAPGTYTVTLIDQNALGCKDTFSQTISVYPSPNSNFTFGTTCINSPVNFVDTSTNYILNYNWNLGTGGATSNLQNPTYTYTAAGTYTVYLVTNALHGCSDSVAQTVIVHPLPDIDISNDTTICPYTSAQLYAHGGVTYLWSPYTGLSDSSVSNPIASPPPPGPITYTVDVVDQFSCRNNASVTISQFPVPQIDAGPDTSVCLNPVNYHDSVQLTATGGVAYLWQPPAGLSATNIANPLAKPTANTTYFVTGTDANGCSLTDSVTVYVLDPSLNLIVQDSEVMCQNDTVYPIVINQGGSQYVWDPTAFLTNPNSWNTGFFPPVTTNYILTVSNYCYSKTDTILIVVYPIPQLNLNPLDSVCYGNSIQLQAYNAVTYSWSPNPTLSSTTISNPVATPLTNTEYIVTGTNQFGCTNTDSTLILVYLSPLVHVGPHVPFICQGASIRLNAVGAYRYNWVPPFFLDSSDVADPIATPNDTIQYTVIGTNIHGCTASDSLTINVQLPVTAVSVSPLEACLGIPLQLHASGGFYYQWSPPQGLNDAETNEPFALPDSTTYYIVKVSNDCFSDTAGVEIIVHQPPYVDAGADTTIWRDTYASLHGITYVSNYFWNPSTFIDNAFDLNTTTSPPQTSWYELFAIDSFGCKNMDSVLITVVPYTILDIPTGFSPNNDGVNDVFRIARNLNIDHLEEFSVFDRWGVQVFTTDNINHGWDGTFEGKPQPIGVYVWMVVAATKDGEHVVKKGNVTLLR